MRHFIFRIVDIFGDSHEVIVETRGRMGMAQRQALRECGVRGIVGPEVRGSEWMDSAREMTDVHCGHHDIKYYKRKKRHICLDCRMVMQVGETGRFDDERIK